MSRETWVPLATIGAIAVIFAAAWGWLGASREAEQRAARQERERCDEERAAAEREVIATESADLLSESFPGLVLGATLEEVRATRPAGAVHASTSRVDPGYSLYEEQFENGAQVVYAFDEDHRLARLQVLSMLPSVEAIAPHLAAMHDRYGSPTGVWDCADAGGVATRRFTWRRAHVALADILLVYGSRVSVTLYVTSNAQMAQSIQRSGCTPASPDALDRFPTTSPDRVQQAAEEEGVAPP